MDTIKLWHAMATPVRQALELGRACPPRYGQAKS